jgi:hypothetical protein
MSLARVDFLAQPFVPLYRTDDLAAELSNRTIQAVLYLAWAEQASGDYQGQMPVYVRPPRPARLHLQGPSSSRSAISSSIRHSCATSKSLEPPGSRGRRRSRMTIHDTPMGSSRCQTRLQPQHSSTPHRPGEGADRFIPIGTDGALGHYLGRGLDAAFTHVIHVCDERSLRSSGSQVRRRGRTPCRRRRLSSHDQGRDNLKYIRRGRGLTFAKLAECQIRHGSIRRPPAQGRL